MQESLNTVYYAVGEDKKAGMSPAKVLDMAYDLGIKQVWAGAPCGGKRLPLNGSNGNEIWPHCLGADVSFGAYNVTVQDMANVMATFANNGVRADEHFVNYVNQGYGSDAHKVYQTAVHVTPVPGYTHEMANDEQWAMQQVYKNSDENDNKLDGHREAAVKTGTWEYDGKNAKPGQNSSGFFNGYTAGGDPKNGAIATSVWVGFTGAPMAVVDQRGHTIGGATVPAAVWAAYMNAYLNNGPGGRPYPNQQFEGLQNTGDPELGETSSPAPPPPPTQNPCNFPPLCRLAVEAAAVEAAAVAEAAAVEAAAVPPRHRRNRPAEGQPHRRARRAAEAAPAVADPTPAQIALAGRRDHRPGRPTGLGRDCR